ncbi:hypothetical protein [Paracraurococcus ruber]|nr:hypothetical protein [Paracraurococcus ruber]TDG33735.1 hypothetical protein E2C05_02650 [Paracraurococcus ruber]
MAGFYRAQDRDETAANIPRLLSPSAEAGTCRQAGAVQPRRPRRSGLATCRADEALHETGRIAKEVARRPAAAFLGIEVPPWAFATRTQAAIAIVHALADAEKLRCGLDIVVARRAKAGGHLRMLGGRIAPWCPPSGPLPRKDGA